MIKINKRKWAFVAMLALIVLAVVAVSIEAQRGGRSRGGGGSGGGGGTEPVPTAAPDNGGNYDNGGNVGNVGNTGNVGNYDGNVDGNYDGSPVPVEDYTAEDCATCHASEYNRFVQSVMASAVECYDCHKIPSISEHRMRRGMTSYNPTNEDCRACHAASDPYHTKHVDMVGVDCTYCHTEETIAKPDLTLPDVENTDRRTVPAEACIVCHSDSFYYGAQ